MVIHFDDNSEFHITSSAVHNLGSIFEGKIFSNLRFYKFNIFYSRYYTSYQPTSPKCPESCCIIYFSDFFSNSFSFFNISLDDRQAGRRNFLEEYYMEIR